MSFSSLITIAERPSANFLISVLCCYTLNVRSKSFRIYACLVFMVHYLLSQSVTTTDNSYLLSSTTALSAYSGNSQ